MGGRYPRFADPMIAGFRHRLKIFRKRFPSRLPRQAVVVDVGSGHRPHPRADILVEKFLDDDYQRGLPFVSGGRPVVVGDVTALPFRDLAADYIICSHVLEHIPSAAALRRALAELTRVAPRGYIETPSVLAEKLIARSFHHWYVALRGGTLRLRRKVSGDLDPDVVPAMLEIERESRTFENLLWEQFDRFHTRLEWAGGIPYDIEEREEMASGGAGPEGWECVHRHEPLPPRHRIRQRLRNIQKEVLRRCLWGRRHINLESLLACPVCRGSLRREEGKGGLGCVDCGRRYPVQNGIPYLLPELAERSH